MNSDLLNFIRGLSEKDKKNLTQKALKTTEEVGELAKAILPFENAAGTLHRFSDRTKILENVVDVFLTSISIAYDMKFSDEEIEEMILEKAKKWQSIQSKENEIAFPLPYEIHVTIKKPDDLDYLKDFCEKIGTKLIVIDLEKNNEIVMQDVMTSSVHWGDNRSAYEEAMRIKNRINEHIFTRPNWIVTRVKIETVPWHPAAPRVSDEKQTMPDDCYFESHLRIVTKESDRRRLETIAAFFKAHLSRNYFKKLSNDNYIIMMTLRNDNTSYERFKIDVEQLSNHLKLEGFEVDKTEIEFAVYDSLKEHDIKWIAK